MRSSTKLSRIILVIIVTAAALSYLPPRLSAQAQGTAFSVDDLLDVVNLSFADLSDDGRWLVATTGLFRDRIGIDNHRFGDPTYIAPNSVDVLIIDTQTAKSQKLFPEKRHVRGLQWSPDASRLALLMLNKDVFEPMIWERASGKLQKVNLPAGKLVADNSDLQWSNDGKQLLLALRTEEWRKKTAERFRYETAGPVVVHSSNEPFIAWDD